MSTNVHGTSKFSVLDLPSVKVNNQIAAPAVTKRDASAPTRAKVESGARIVSKDAILIGGEFNAATASAAGYQKERTDIFDDLWEKYQKSIESKQEEKISITLPSGEVKEGFLHKTSPMDIAVAISQVS